MTNRTLHIPEAVQEEISRGSLFVINDSGGKDSQCMKALLLRHIPHSQVLVVHAELPEVDWDGLREHIELNTPSTVEIRYTRAVKTFFEMVERRYEKDPSRPCFPSPQIRQCTSDLKRGPIDRAVRHWLKEHPTHSKRIVHCIGIRAEESVQRSKAVTWKQNKRESKAGRTVFEWLPIHDFSEREVRATVAEDGQELHWAYGAGMTRLSCCFCIMASKQDLRTAARLRPELAKRYVELETRTGYTMSMAREPLANIIAA